MDRTRRASSPPATGRCRVLYFSRVDLPNGKANSIQTLNTAYEMARAGADVHLVVRRLLQSRRDCFTYYGLAEHSRLRLVSLSLPVDSDFNDWRGKYFSVYLKAFLARHGRGATLLFTRDPAGLELLWQCRRMRLHPGIRVVFEVHNLSFLTKAGHQQERGRSLEDPAVQAKLEARRQLEAEVYGFVDGLVCTSTGARDLVDEHFPGHAPLCVVPNGTRIPCDAAGRPRVAAELDDTCRDLDVLYVGQLYAWKGVEGLVHAMSLLPDRRLTIVGGNDPEDIERLRALAASLGVAGRIDFVGQVAPHAVDSYFERARVGVVPLPRAGSVEAASFTSPLKLFELLRAGVPIVATDLPSIRELVRDGEHALLVPPDDPAALARGIETVLADRRLAARLVRAGADRVLDFAWEARARRILEFTAGLKAAHHLSRV